MITDTSVETRHKTVRRDVLLNHVSAVCAPCMSRFIRLPRTSRTAGANGAVCMNAGVVA
jgi:hypothetical protein